MDRSNAFSAERSMENVFIAVPVVSIRPLLSYTMFRNIPLTWSGETEALSGLLFSIDAICAGVQARMIFIFIGVRPPRITWNTCGRIFSQVTYGARAGESAGRGVPDAEEGENQAAFVRPEISKLQNAETDASAR